jgi:hypothetical protein
MAQTKDEWDGSDMWWHPIESLKLPYTGHLLAREADQEQHGEEQLHQSWRKLVFYGAGSIVTKDRGRWKQIVDALCPIGDEEDK